MIPYQNFGWDSEKLSCLVSLTLPKIYCWFYTHAHFQPKSLKDFVSNTSEVCMSACCIRYYLKLGESTRYYWRFLRLWISLDGRLDGTLGPNQPEDVDCRIPSPASSPSLSLRPKFHRTSSTVGPVGSYRSRWPREFAHPSSSSKQLAALGLRHPKITSGSPAAYKPLHLHCLLRITLHTAAPQVDWREGEAPNYPVANLERVHQLNNVQCSTVNCTLRTDLCQLPEGNYGSEASEYYIPLISLQRSRTSFLCCTKMVAWLASYPTPNYQLSFLIYCSLAGPGPSMRPSVSCHLHQESLIFLAIIA